MPSLPIARRRSRFAAILVLLAATGAAVAAPAVVRSGEGAGPSRCELEVARRGGSLELTALAHADKALRGEYALRVSGPGTDIRQGGPFAVAAGRSERLGSVTIGAGRYDADLKIVVDGRTIACPERAGGRA